MNFPTNIDIRKNARDEELLLHFFLEFKKGCKLKHSVSLK